MYVYIYIYIQCNIYKIYIIPSIQNWVCLKIGYPQIQWFITMFAIQIDIFVAYINISKHQLVSLANAILSVVSPKMVPKISSAVCGSISDTRAGIIQRSMTLMPLKGTTGLQETPKLRFSHIMSYLLSKHCFPGNICIFSESNMFSHIIGYHIPLSFNGFSFFSRFYTTIIPSHIMFP